MKQGPTFFVFLTVLMKYSRILVDARAQDLLRMEVKVVREIPVELGIVFSSIDAKGVLYAKRENFGRRE